MHDGLIAKAISTYETFECTRMIIFNIRDRGLSVIIIENQLYIAVVEANKLNKY